MTVRKINGPEKIWLEIDHSDAATPALVCIGKNRFANYSSTYDCALGSGFIDDRHELTARQIAWLQSDEISNIVETAYSEARKDAPEYN